jgi:hypothetical protein
MSPTLPQVLFYSIVHRDTQTLDSSAALVKIKANHQNGSGDIFSFIQDFPNLPKRTLGIRLPMVSLVTTLSMPRIG